MLTAKAGPLREGQLCRSVPAPCHCHAGIIPLLSRKGLPGAAAPNKYLPEMHVALGLGFAWACCRCFVSRSPHPSLRCGWRLAPGWGAMGGERGWQLEERITETPFLREIR